MAIELGEFIERGLALRAAPGKGGFPIEERPLSFIHRSQDSYHAGALGLALIGKAGDPQTALNGWLQVSNVSPAGKLEVAAEQLGIPVALVRLVALNHRNGVPACEIARSLRLGNLGLGLQSPARHLYQVPGRSFVVFRQTERVPRELRS